MAEAARVLKPGGQILFRDYGLYDLVQTRCKKRVGKRDYVKEDGLRCCFFSLEDVVTLMADAGGLRKVECGYCTVRNVNRKTKAAMDRVWVSGVFQKPLLDDDECEEPPLGDGEDAAAAPRAPAQRCPPPPPSLSVVAAVSPASVAPSVRIRVAGSGASRRRPRGPLSARYPSRRGQCGGRCDARLA